MKKLNAYLLVVLLSVIGFACKEDPLESITIKTSGKLSITLLNGNQPVANQKVWFESAVSGFEDVFFTDANGKIDFEALNAGPYVLYTTIDEPYTQVEQEIHVISGEHIQKEILIQNHVGTYKYSIRDNYNGTLVTEDLGLKILFVPINEAYHEAMEYGPIQDHMFELAAKEVNVGSQGIITVDLPVAQYNVYLVKEDRIINAHNYRYVYRYENSSSTFYVYPDDLRD